MKEGHGGLLLLLLLLLPKRAFPAKVRLWEMGSGVDENPYTTFCMFALTVLLTVLVEVAKHRVEHRSTDVYARQALKAIYMELMMVGIVSFLLIMSAGVIPLEKIQVPYSCEDDDEEGSHGANATVTLVGSGSGVKLCGVGFNLYLFEYAHLVIFVMGLSYALFLQLSLLQLRRLARSIEDYTTTLADTIGLLGENHPFTTYLTLRGITAIMNEQRIRDVCNPRLNQLERLLANLQSTAMPPVLPDVGEALNHFHFGVFVRHTMGKMLIEMTHAPSVVWVSIMLIASVNTITRLGITLSATVTISAFLSPILSFALFFSLRKELRRLAQAGCGHPRLPETEHYLFSGARPSSYPFMNKESGERWGQGGADPWAVIQETARGRLLSSPKTKFGVQVVIYITCYYLGQLVMLTVFIADQKGVFAVLGLYLLALVPFYVLPRAILYYSLLVGTREPPLDVLEASLVNDLDRPSAGGSESSGDTTPNGASYGMVLG